MYRNPTLAQHYNQPGTFATGDLTGDDAVNFPDLLRGAAGSARPTQARGVTLAPAEQDGAKRNTHRDVLAKRLSSPQQHGGAGIPTR